MNVEVLDYDTVKITRKTQLLHLEKNFIRLIIEISINVFFSNGTKIQQILTVFYHQHFISETVICVISFLTSNNFV